MNSYLKQDAGNGNGRRTAGARPGNGAGRVHSGGLFFTLEPVSATLQAVDRHCDEGSNPAGLCTVIARHEAIQ
jgi:hypothetical protein